MALTETTEYDKIEVVSIYKHVQVRKATVIKKDDVELTRSFERYVLDAGTLDESDNLIDNPLDKEPDGVTAIPDEVKNVCNVVWTTDVKALWKANLIANKTTKQNKTMKNQKRIDQLKLEAQVAVDEFNKIQEKIKELILARDSFKMKAFSCSERLKELLGEEEVTTEVKTEVVE